MSLKYSVIKTMFHIIPMQKMMAKPYDELLKMFRTAEAKPAIPELKDPELTFQTHKVEGFPVLEISHKKKSEYACIYVAGGGMLKYPKPSQAKELVTLAKETNIFKGMIGDKELPDELLYTSRGIYDGIKDVYLSYGGDEVFSAAAQSTAQCLRNYGAKVTLEIADGMYHTYAMMPLVKEALPGHQRLVAYLTVK